MHPAIFKPYGVGYSPLLCSTLLFGDELWLGLIWKCSLELEFEPLLRGFTRELELLCMSLMLDDEPNEELSWLLFGSEINDCILTMEDSLKSKLFLQLIGSSLFSTETSEP